MRVKAFCLLVPLAFSANCLAAGTDTIPAEGGDISIYPLNHATFAMRWKETVVYVDPVGEAGRFKDLAAPTLILITDIHPDHLSEAALKAILKPDTKLVASRAVAEKLPPDLRGRTTILPNGQSNTVSGVSIEAIPAYNVTAERMKFHEKGRGNGYVVTLGGRRVYISGDTEDTPEVRSLKNIDAAFLCMNLPYTMTVEQAAEAVKAFRPKVVYPYHYRGSDVEKFKKLVGAASEVRLRDWYGKP